MFHPDVQKALAALGVGKNAAPEAEVAELNAKRLANAQKMEEAGIEKSEIEMYMKNANEVMHTGNTGYGAELIPTDVLMGELVDLIPKYATFLGQLPGFHGTDMPVSAKVAVIGEAGFFYPNSEPTTGALGPVGQATHRLATGEVTITQGQFIAKIALSKRELNYSITDLEALIKRRLAESAARTIEALIINADAEPGATGNVNKDDGTPSATTDYYMEQDHGLRELGINGSGTAVAGGTFDMGDLVGAMNILGDLAANPADLLWLFNRATYNEALLLDEFSKANERGAASVIAGNAISNIYGADLFIARDLPKTEADGKVSATPSNNTKGQIVLFNKNSVQYGYGQPLEIDVEKVAGKGVNIVATFEFGFTVAQKLAGQADSSVAVVRDITLS